MENELTHTEQIEQILELITEENMSLIDFDQIRDWLQQMKQELASASEVREEAGRFRHDYNRRLAGMVKAIAAVDRKRGTQQQALDLIESLKSMKVEDLMACFARVSARFRDCFPASYGLLRSGGPAAGGKRIQGGLN